LKFELESKSVVIKGVKQGIEKECKVDFGYLLLDSIVPTNVFSVK